MPVDSEDFTPQDIEMLEKKLNHLMRAYSVAEGIFPSWEAAFALLIGQLLIACLGNYASLHKILLLMPVVNPKSLFILLTVFGLVLSIFWLIMVSLNLQHANTYDTKIRACEKSLSNAYQNKKKSKEDIKTLEFGSAFIEPDERPGWKNIFLGHKKGENFKKNALPKLLTSTWLYRRLLPIVSIAIWIILIFVKDP